MQHAFRIPLVPWIPILSMLGSLVLIVSLPLVTIIRFIVWLAIGLIIYFLYSQRKSHLQQEAVAAESGGGNGRASSSNASERR